MLILLIYCEYRVNESSMDEYPETRFPMYKFKNNSGTVDGSFVILHF